MIGILPISMKIAAKTIGMDLVAVQPLSAPVGNLTYMNYKYASIIIKEDIFVAILNSEKLGITKGNKYDVGIFEEYKGIQYTNDDGEIKEIYADYKHYFITIVESRKNKLRKIFNI
jgi:Major capsid protein Gp23